jgi:hypothetical protein
MLLKLLLQLKLLLNSYSTPIIRFSEINEVINSDSPASPVLSTD